MKSSQKIAVLIAVIAVLWIASGLVFATSDAQGNKEQTQEQTAVEKIKVRARDVDLQEYTEQIIVTGQTQGDNITELSSELSTQLDEVYKEEGSFVKQGDPLALLEVKDRQAKVSEAKERFNQRQIEYNAAKKLENKGYNSKVKLAQASADLEEAKADLEAARIELNKTKIIAPFDGIVDERFLDVGSFVNAGNKLFRLVDLDPIKIIGFVSEHELGLLEVGKPAIAKLLDGTEIEGKLSFIAANANEQTRTFRVEMKAPNPDFAIKSGLTAKLLIQAKTKTAHKISPSSLALNDKGEIGVKYVDSDNIVHFKKVEILSDQPTHMWVDGLPEETIRLITVGQYYVTEGQEVEPVLSENKDENL